MNIVPTAPAPGVVIVGTGHGCRVHVPAFRNAGCTVRALVGSDLDRTRRRAARAGVDIALTSLEDALKLRGTDIVVISTPPVTHAELAEQAIAAGRHVLLEKPFTVDSAEGSRLVAAAERAGVVAVVGHEFRFAPERVTLAAALRDGVIGRAAVATFITQNAFLRAITMPDWWYDPARGGGWLMAGVSHTIDTIRFTLGEFEQVSAALPLATDRDPSIRADDSVSLRFRLHTGCEGVLQDNAAAWGPSITLHRIMGPAGTLQLSNGALTLANEDGVRELELVVPPRLQEPALHGSDSPYASVELPAATAQAGVLRDLVAGVNPDPADGTPATFADGLACMEVIDAIRRSASSGGAAIEVSASTPSRT